MASYALAERSYGFCVFEETIIVYHIMFAMCKCGAFCKFIDVDLEKSK